MHGKTMREALQEARDYRDDTNEGGPGSGPQKGGKKQSSANIKKAYGILNDPRFKQGNYSGAAKAIDKLSPGLSNHPDVKNAMKRANEELDETMVVTKVDKDTNSPAYQKFKAGDKRYVYKENLDLSATGDTTTSNASQELDEIVEEDLKEYTGGSPGMSVSSNTVKTALKNLSKGQALHVSGKPQRGLRTMGRVISISGDTVKIKPTASNGPTSANVKDITSMDVMKEELVEKIIPGQLARLKKEWEPLRKVDMSKHQKTIDQIKVKLKRLNPSSLSQIVRADIFMVSDIAKELMKEEIDEAVVGLPFSRTLMYIIKTDRNTATRIKSFLADNGEKYPIHIDDNGSGQITLDAYNYTGGEKKAALAAAQAIAKKFNVKVNATR